VKFILAMLASLVVLIGVAIIVVVIDFDNYEDEDVDDEF
jgi:hypothetical protein